MTNRASKVVLVGVRAAVGNGSLGSVGGDVRGGLAGGDTVSSGCGVVDGGNVSRGLADEGRGGGWGCPANGGCCPAARTLLVEPLAAVVAAVVVVAWAALLREWMTDPLA